MVYRIITFAYVSVCRIIIVRKIDHYSFLQWYAFFHRFPTFWTSQLQGNMIMYPSILVLLLGICPMLDFNFPRATVKMLLYAFSKYFSCGNFVRSAWLYVTRCVSWEPWIYWLGTLKLIHVWPENRMVATDWVSSLDLLFISQKVFVLFNFVLGFGVNICCCKY